MTQNNEKVTQKCKGTNCGTTNNNHSKECLAEHEAAYKSNEYDTAGNRHPEFRYKGYKGEPIPNNHTIDQFNAYAEGIKARVSPISQNEQPKQIPDGWISVEDRLPTDDRTVICADYGKFKINDYIPAPDEIFGCNFYKGNWLGDAFGDYPYILKVTHWMPLPAPTNTEVVE